MTQGPAPALELRRDGRTLALLALLAFALEVSVDVAVSVVRDIPLSALAVYHDGHLYIEIAKSYPLPYGPGADHYLGQAPGYPALIHIVRVLTPNALVNWGTAALLASWLGAAGAAGAFYALCHALRTAPLWPTLAFIVANPRWVSLGASGFAEPLAVCFAILCFAAFARGRLGWSVAWLSLAALTRFPAILLGVPLAFGALVSRRQLSFRTLCTLATPLLAFGLFNLYLAMRMPDFANVWTSHGVFWNPRLTCPFSVLLELFLQPRVFGEAMLTRSMIVLTYGSVIFYVIAIAIGFRPSERERWFLPIWVAVIVVFHVSLSGRVGGFAFSRLAILAWPAALLIVWRLVGTRMPRAVACALCAVTASVSLAYSTTEIAAIVEGQRQRFLPDTIMRLDSDEPFWIDFRQYRRQAKQLYRWEMRERRRERRRERERTAE